MKFEIYSDSEFIYDIDEKHDLTDDNEYPIAQLKQLEQILQAVKKTQTKLVNKQIQEIQDSKNHEYNPWAKSSFSPTSKTEQNQKIVEAILEQYQFTEDTLKNSKDLNLSERDKIQISYLNTTLSTTIKKTTGKDIKDL